MQVQQNIPLAPLTTLKVGGPARFFTRAEEPGQVLEAVGWAEARKLPLFILGGGSNLVISDAGWPGLVLQIAVAGITQSEQDGKQVFAIGAGVEWDAFVEHAVRMDCGGVECMSGIPGTVGGTPIQNVGAYGQEVSETIRQVEVLDLSSKTVRVLSNEQCGFSYRSSIFNQSERGHFIVLRVSYALAPGAAPHLEYADLKKVFAGKTAPSLAATREAVRQIRRSKAMLIVPGDPDACSAGSFFKNPIVTKQQWQEISARPAARGENVPSFPGANGQLKVSAAWLVEHAGFRRGYTRGNAGISSKHALAIVNRGAATAAEVVALQQEVQERVFDAFGVQLAPEPVFVGFD